MATPSCAMPIPLPGTRRAHRCLCLALRLSLCAVLGLLPGAAALGSVSAGTCNTSTFSNTSGQECWGLHREVSGTSPDECAIACCKAGLACTTWNFCPDPSGATCGHSDSGGCYIGIPGYCKPTKGWVGGVKTPGGGGQCNATSFPTDVSGRECHGLQRAANASAHTSSEACEAACCGIGDQCTTWQFCANALFCGSPSAGGGCWVAAEGQKLSCNTVQDGWQGRSRVPLPPPPPPAPPQNVTIDLGALGLALDGIGGITSNGECRLLYDYPEPQRGEILDYLFLPRFALSSQLLKVEIGSDAQSTVGTEPAYQHSRGLVAYDRGVQFWFMREAKRRNPDIQIAALEWSAPGWVGNGSFFSEDNIAYILGWLHGAEVANNVTVDYLGIWNEPPISSIPADWIVQLRAGLDGAGYGHIRIMAPDAGATQSVTVHLLKDMTARADVRAAVDIIGTHGYWDSVPPMFASLHNQFGTRAWVSESWHGMGSWGGGATTMAGGIISSHLQGNYTGWTAWGLLFSAYPNVLCQDKCIMYATSPWGKGYQAEPALWTTAHITQFSRIGWRFARQGFGSGVLPSNVVYATLVSETGDFSLIVDAFSLSTGSMNVTFSLESLRHAGKRLQLWTTDAAQYFARGPDVTVSAEGTFSLTLQALTLYSLTTLPEGAIAKGSHPHSELDALFPLPHRDDFEALAVGRSPRFFTDWDGSFNAEAAGDRGGDRPAASGENIVLRQMVQQRPMHWHCTDVDPITLVGEGLQNYAVSAIARIESESTVSYSGTYVAVYARILRPYSGWCPAQSGYRLRVTSSGDWSLEYGVGQQDEHSLANGTLPGFNASAWHNLTVACDGDAITARVNGTLLATVDDASYDSGSAGVGTGYHYAAFDSVEILPLRPTPDNVVNQNGQAANEQQALAAYCGFTNTGRTNTSSGWFGFAFEAAQDIAVTQVARFSSAGNRMKHALRLFKAPNASAPARSLTSAIVDMGNPNRRLDSSGFVHVSLAAPVPLVKGQTYYLVSQETSGGDAFYAAALKQPCAGSIGPGGTAPRLNLLSDAIKVLGAVSTADPEAASGWQIAADWDPRSYGPLTFSFAIPS